MCKSLQALAAIGERVRRILSDAGMARTVNGPERKLRAVRCAVKYSFPTADIERMLREIERGYEG